MAKKTNKTSHVLNLITNGNPPEPAEQPAAASAQESQPAAASQEMPSDAAGTGTLPAASMAAEQSVQPISGNVPAAAPVSEKKVIVVDDSETNRLSDEIRDQLISHLEAEEKQAKEKAEAAKAEEPQAESEPEAKAEAAKAEEPQAESEPEAKPEPVKVEEPQVESKAEAKPEPAKAEEPQAAAEPEAKPEPVKPAEPEYRMVNVMEQILKRYKLEDQMKRYGVCMCSRCRADVEALALTKLPAKYVVVDSSSVAPIIGFYETRFRVNILTQVIKACMQVKDNPHHK